VLVVEDEPQMRRFLRTTLECHGYRLAEAGTGHDGLMQASARNPDVVLLDLGLPDQDGLEVTKRLREWTATPIIVLSARGQEEDKVKALDAGADDYLTKPFAVGELLARLRVALRHAAQSSGGAAAEPVFEAGALRVDLGAREVSVDGAGVHLTPIEYKLLTTLIKHAGKVVTHRLLLEQVWGPTHVNEAHYLRVYMAQLRRKLEPNPARPRQLLTEPGVGYRLKVE
jgi:two-component system KDP operon response regulator KdpE